MQSIKTVTIYLMTVAIFAACSKKVPINPIATESTSAIYPFEPIPVPAYEGFGLATHPDLRIAEEMARTQAMADLGSNIFETVSSRVNEMVNSRTTPSSMLNAARSLSTSVPLVGKKFIDYRIGQKTGTVYCRVYMAKSEVDSYVGDRLAGLARDLIDGPIRSQLQAQISGGSNVNTDVQMLTAFHEEQLKKGRTPTTKK